MGLMANFDLVFDSKNEYRKESSDLFKAGERITIIFPSSKMTALILEENAATFLSTWI